MHIVQVLSAVQVRSFPANKTIYSQLLLVSRMSQRVHAMEGNEVREFASEKGAGVKNQISPEEFKTFKEQLSEMCKTLNAMNEKLVDQERVELDAPETLWERIKDNTLRDMFVGKDVTSDDVDNVVNTLTLMNALILTIPYGLMASASHDYWDWVETTLEACPDTKFTYDQAFTVFSNSFNAVVYSTISVLVMAMAYYLLRPRTDVKFQKWWKNARYVLIIMLIGTITSCVSLIAISAWLFSWYIVPTSQYCTYTAQTQALVGIFIIVACFAASAFLML